MRARSILQLLFLSHSAVLALSAATPGSLDGLKVYVGDAALDILCSQTFPDAAAVRRDMVPRALKTVTSTIRRTTTALRTSTKVVTSRPVQTITRTATQVIPVTRTTTTTRTYTKVVAKRSASPSLEDLFYELFTTDRESLKEFCDGNRGRTEPGLFIQARAPTTTTVKRVTTTSTRYSTTVKTRTTVLPTTTTVRRTRTSTSTSFIRATATASAQVSLSAQKYVTCPTVEGFVFDDQDVGASAADQMECRYTRLDPENPSILFCQYSTATGTLLTSDPRTDTEVCPRQVAQSPTTGLGCIGLQACPGVNPDPKLILNLSRSSRSTFFNSNTGVFSDTVTCFYFDSSTTIAAECAYDANSGTFKPDENDPEASCPSSVSTPTTYCLRRARDD